MDKKHLLLELEEQIKTCRKCRLCDLAKRAVPGEGNPNTDIVFIGEAPGATEDELGRPFVGRAGQLLEFLLHQINLTRPEIWIGNIVKHRPPQNRDPLPDEIESCQPYLTTQLNIIKPPLIVTLGRYSMNYFLPDVKISKAHGQVYQAGEYNIYPVYHPAAALRNSEMKKTLILDFLEIPNVLQGIKNNKEQTTQSPLTSKRTELKNNNENDLDQSQNSKINLL
jgi:DNA polymerase